VNPCGVVVVAPPWNFPYAIAAGGVLAASAAGNTALLKPSPEAPATAALLVGPAAQARDSTAVRSMLVAAPDGPVVGI
jgi:RHH-type proline utilization regulon transcriptional repressor/proline dehydrogenase/delta 1-pyrroline-5-carboxylate dehydrogenase